MKKKTIGLIIFFVAMATFFLLTMNSGGSDNSGAPLDIGSVNKEASMEINSVVYADDGSLDVVWNFPEDATGYEIYRANTADGEFTLVGSADSETFVFNDADVENYKTYYYQVKALMQNEEPMVSKTVHGYTQGKLINSNINVEVGWNDGTSFLMETGTDIGCSRQKVDLTIFDGDTPISDYTLYCDEEILKPIKQDNGITVINPSKRGNYIITVMTEDVVGSVKIVFDEFYTSDLSLSWSGRTSDIFSDRIIEPEQQKISYGVIDGNKNPISGYTVTSSDPRICSVKMDGDRFILSNNSPGNCFINVKYRGQTIKYEFLVRGGLATEELNNIEFQSGVAIGKGIEQNKAAEIIKQFTTPQYTSEEIEQMVKDGLTLDQCAEKITTAADAVNLLLAMDYGKEPKDLMKDLDYINEEEGVGWLYDYSAELNFKLRYGYCAGTSNLMNRLLMDNFEEMGYVIYLNTISGGHIFNYFKVDDIYVVCDFVRILDDFNYENKKYPVDITNYFEYICRTPEEFKEKYWTTNPVATVPDPVEGIMAYFAFYEKKGDPHPTGWPLDDSKVFIMPEQYKDSYDVLFVRDGYTTEFRYLEEDKLPECRKPTHEYLKN